MKIYKGLGGILAALGLSMLWTTPAAGVVRPGLVAVGGKHSASARRAFVQPAVVPSRRDALLTRTCNSPAHCSRDR